MNSNIAFQIIYLALSLLKVQAGGKVEQGITYAGLLVKIVQKGFQAYQEHTGKKLDPSLIKAETLV